MHTANDIFGAGRFFTLSVIIRSVIMGLHLVAWCFEPGTFQPSIVVSDAAVSRPHPRRTFLHPNVLMCIQSNLS